MAQYEYIEYSFCFGDLAQLNRFASQGWRVVAVIDTPDKEIALLERELTDAAQG